MGTVNRPASPAELEQMRQLVAQAMQDGAMGISTALEYLPDTLVSTDNSEFNGGSQILCNQVKAAKRFLNETSEDCPRD